jgi:acyl carrier protein
VTLETADLQVAMLELLVEPLAAIGLHPGAVPDDFDLLAEGVIDSFGVLELISALGVRYATTLDFSELSAEDLTVVGPLARHLTSQITGER